MGVRVKEWDGGKGGKKAWWIFIDHNRKRKARRIGPGPEGRKAAVLIAEKIQAKLALGDFDVNDEPRVTFGQFAEGWIARYVEHNLRLTTAKKYIEVLRIHWLPTLGHLAMPDLTRQHIRQTIQRWQSEGLKNSTLRWFLNVLQSCLEAAVEEGLIDTNPAAKSTKWVLRAKSAGDARLQIFTAPELKHLLRKAAARGPSTYAMVLTMARTGMRISEMLGLRVEDVDLERREMQVRRTWGNHARGPEYFGPTKGKPRVVDMSLQLRDTLKAWIEPLEGEWLFPGPHGVPSTPNNFYATHWKPLFDTQVIAYRHPHTLRHTYATHLLWQGESPAYIQNQLGHASIRITVDIYGHWIPSVNKRAVDRLDDTIESAASIRKSDASNESKGLKLIRGGGS